MSQGETGSEPEPAGGDAEAGSNEAGLQMRSGAVVYLSPVAADSQSTDLLGLPSSSSVLLFSI